MNAWTVSYFWDTLDALKVLPKLDSTRPLSIVPEEGTLPPLMKRAFDEYLPLFREHFTFNPLMQAMIQDRKFDLDEMRSRFDGAPLVGCARSLSDVLRSADCHAQRALPRRRQDWLRVHHLGAHELVRRRSCPERGADRLGSGNVTIHAESAWNAVQPYLEGRPGVKPTLALLTAEADAFDKFVVSLPSLCCRECMLTCLQERPGRQPLQRRRDAARG